MSEDETKYSDAPVDKKDKGTVAEGLVLEGILKGNWRDFKKDKGKCACDGSCGCKDKNHLKIVK